MDQKRRRELGVGGSKFMDQMGRREVRVGLCITTRLGREVRWVGGGGGGWLCPWLRGDGHRMWVSISESTQTRTVTLWRLSSHTTSPKVIHYITNPIIIM